jgi:predicted porin
MMEISMSVQNPKTQNHAVSTQSVALHKKVLPVAIGIALGVFAAHNSTAQQLPTVYGKINVTLDQFDYEGAARVLAGQAPAVVDQWEVNSNASRLGIKGELALENTGLTVVYLAEFETNADDGSSSPFSQRNIYAGLQGNFGRIIGGKFDTPLKVIEGKVDQFNDLRADIDVLVGGQNRADNIIQYSTPKFASVLTANLALLKVWMSISMAKPMTV